MSGPDVIASLMGMEGDGQTTGCTVPSGRGLLGLLLVSIFQRCLVDRSASSFSAGPHLAVFFQSGARAALGSLATTRTGEHFLADRLHHSNRSGFPCTMPSSMECEGSYSKEISGFFASGKKEHVRLRCRKSLGITDGHGGLSFFVPVFAGVVHSGWLHIENSCRRPVAR